MSQQPRNALSGYVFQNLVYFLFVSIMDINKEIVSITAEKKVTHNFDDIYIKCENEEYYIQVKNYQNFKLSDITIEDNIIKIKRHNPVNYDYTKKNILIFESDDLSEGNSIFGIDCVIYDRIYIILLNSERIYAILCNLLEDKRIIKLQKTVDNAITKKKYVLSRAELPSLDRFELELNEETIVKRNLLSKINSGITHIIGKPGVGKSHYFNELRETFNFDIEYRFWISSIDENIKKRRLFDEFLKDIGIAIFENSKKHTYNEIVSKINADNLSVIVDGLDHIENYNKGELDEYIKFFNDISSSKVVILSRPLIKKVSWKKYELSYWDVDILEKFLEKKYGFRNQLLIEEIYEKTKGYPIICSFLAEHYKSYNELPKVSNINEVNEYYTQLFEKDYEDEINYDDLSIFLLNNYFITMEEIEDYLGFNSIYIKSIIKRYHYLFNVTLNRVTLIHDSLNTFLKEKFNYQEYCHNFIPNIQKSILNKEIRYLSRFNGFEFDDEFNLKVIKLYSNFDVLKELLNNNIDFESIKEFYLQLKILFGDYRYEFDIYQYYSFILICLLFDRVDLVGYEDLIFHTIKYMENGDMDETTVYSQGLFWQSYIYYKKEDWRENRILYRSYTIRDKKDIFNKENNYYLFKKYGFDENKAIKYLKNMKNNYQKEEIVMDFFINSKIYNSNSGYSKIIDDYLNNDFNFIKEDVHDFYKKINLNETPSQSRWSIVPYIIKTKNENILKQYENLKELIEEKSKEGSFITHDYINSYIRLKNYEHELQDINEINKFYTMYYNRKDLTVININDALLIFEKHNLIKELESYTLLINLIKQSEKGIRHLPYDYIANKKPNFIKTIISTRNINEDLWIYDLDPEYIDELSQKEIVDAFDKLFNRHKFNVRIDYDDVKNIFKSKYSSAFIDHLNMFDFILTNVPRENGLEYKVNKIDFEIEKYEEDNFNHTPLKDNKIIYEDKEFIIKNNISCLELSRCVDYYFYAMPYKDFFNHYDKEELRKKLLKIIHNAMYIKFSFNPEGFVRWAMLLGNIPYLLDLCNYDVNWKKLYQIFNDFVELSLINTDSL